ncbi:MAG: response regulator [Leptospiraceae bacterium]|nr:response regulator [Leptospiraceae bacterium]
MIQIMSMNPFSAVILIDDDEITNYLHKQVLNHSQITDTVYVLLNGKEALDFFKDLNGSFEGELLVLLDINMPIVNGWEFLEKYKHLPVPKDRIHIFILTTSENPRDYERAQEYSFLIQGFFRKPLTKEKISEFIKKVSNA